MTFEVFVLGKCVDDVIMISKPCRRAYSTSLLLIVVDVEFHRLTTEHRPFFPRYRNSISRYWTHERDHLDQVWVLCCRKGRDKDDMIAEQEAVSHAKVVLDDTADQSEAKQLKIELGNVQLQLAQIEGVHKLAISAKDKGQSARART